jgi:uncharacterized membrane protein
MSDKTIYILNFIAIVGTGLIAGVFFAFSSFIMSAFGRLPSAAGMSAMQMINVTVINPLFMAILFGTAVNCLALVFAAWKTGGSANTTILVLATALYVVGTIGITIAYNVPLNENLAAANTTNPDSAKIWAEYLQKWTFWNTMRGLAACASSAMFIGAISNRIQ